MCVFSRMFVFIGAIRNIDANKQIVNHKHDDIVLNTNDDDDDGNYSNSYNNGANMLAAKSS